MIVCLKRPCRGQCLATISKDGNNQIFLIVWAMVYLVTKVIWKWFNRVLKHDLELENGDKLTMVINMQKVCLYFSCYY